MNVGSLFSGIGGIDLGLERAGLRVLWQCEGGGDPNGSKQEREQWKQGEWRRKVLRERFPGVPCYKDVREVACAERDGRRGPLGRTGSRVDAGLGESERDTGAHVDLLCGGFPCQDLSVAGRRRGLAGDRSSLFFEFARVADTIRPDWIIVENVPGLLSSDGGRDFGIVLETLADVGYSVAWRILNSRFFGVPQRRRRVFIVGAFADGDPRAAAKRAGQVLAVGTRCPRHPATGAEAREDAAVASLSGPGSGGADDNDGQVGRLVAGPLLSNKTSGWRGDDHEAASNQYIGFHLTQDPISGDVSPAMSKGSTIGVMDGQGVRRLTPTECERLQGFPDGWTALGPDSRRYAALGDAVTVNVAEWIGRRILWAALDEGRE